MADENLQQPTSKFYTSNKQGFRVTSGVTLTDGELKNETTDYTTVSYTHLTLPTSDLV